MSIQVYITIEWYYYHTLQGFLTIQIVFDTTIFVITRLHCIIILIINQCFILSDYMIQLNILCFRRFSMSVNLSAFEKLASEIWGWSPALQWRDCKFRACFGISSTMVSDVWGRLHHHSLIGKGRPCHILWYLMFLKLYPSENVGSLNGRMQWKTRCK